MRWLLAALLIALASPAALAQTTTFNAGDCSPYVTISNSGRTVTATANPNNSNAVTCQANVGKYSGKWYFPRDPEHGRLEQSGSGSPISAIRRLIRQRSNIGARSPTPSATCCRARRRRPSGRIWSQWRSDYRRALLTRRANDGVAVDMDSNPRQIWVTPDITVTSGCGGGPVWNGDTTTWGHRSIVRRERRAQARSVRWPRHRPRHLWAGRYRRYRAAVLFGMAPTRRSRYRITACRLRRRRSDFTDSTTLDRVIPSYLPWNARAGQQACRGPISRRATSPTRQRGSRALPTRVSQTIIGCWLDRPIHHHQAFRRRAMSPTATTSP